MSGKEIINEAMKYKGKIFPGHSADGSRFVAKIYQSVTGKKLPSNIRELMNTGIKVNKKKIKEGDLIFPDFSHVGIYCGLGNYIFTDSKGNVIFSKANSFFTGRKIF